VSNFFY